MNDNTQIRRVILINWKGMFYQPFDIDSGMTILEGANGTGKTTIMIAIYTCLMPDLNFLNFQNVTSAASRRNEDKGLYGRIGQDESSKDEPIFSVLDITTPKGVRFLVGVQLIKRTYPHVALKHFAVKNLGHEIDIDPLLIDINREANTQQLLELNEISDRCSESGGELVQFRHAKEYFQFLYDNEISPIRLTENEERKKYNQLLHTSLYGGLSRSLQSSLRDYLLPENDRLIKGIQEMEQNLLSCRKTRSAIQRYQSIRETIRRVYQTSLEMFSSAYFATRLNAEEISRKAMEARRQRNQNRELWEAKSGELTRIWEKQSASEEADRELEKRLESAKELLDRSQNAYRIVTELESRKKELKKLEMSVETAQQFLSELRNKRKQATERERSLSKQQMELARQLSDAGRAWQELSRQVGLYQQASRLLNEAKEALATDNLGRDTIPQWLEKAEQELRNAEEEHQQAFAGWNEARLNAESFNRYLDILNSIGERPVRPEDAHAEAEKEIADFYAQRERVKEAESLPALMERLEGQIERKARLKESLTALDLTSVDSSESFSEAWDLLLQEIETALSKRKQLVESIDTTSRKLDQLKKEQPGLEKEVRNWEMFQKSLRELEHRTASSIKNRIELSHLRSNQETELQRLHLEQHSVKVRQKTYQKEYNTLLNEGTSIPGLKGLAEQGFGSLLSDRFEDIPEDWSANLESRLGPLVNALVVKDAEQAAGELSSAFERPDELWLVEEPQKEQLPDAIEVSDAILVKHGDAWRLSRLPEYPSLGKKARANKLEHLASEIKQQSRLLEKLDTSIKGIRDNQSILNKIIPFEEMIEQVSPSDQLKKINEDIPRLESELSVLAKKEEHLQSVIKTMEEREKTSRKLFSEKDLLDLDSPEEQLQQHRKEWEETRPLEKVLSEKREQIKKLQQGVDVLKQPMLENLKALEEKEKAALQKKESCRRVLDILQRLDEVKENFRYGGKSDLLEEKKSINKHLEEELTTIDGDLKQVREQLDELDSAIREAEETSHREEALLNTGKGQLKQLEDDLKSLDTAGSEDQLNEAQSFLKSVQTEKENTEAELNSLKENRYRLEAEIRQLQDERNRLKNRLAGLINQMKPANMQWRTFRKAAVSENKNERFLSEYYSSVVTAKKQPEHYWRKVSSLRSTLVANLEKIADARVVLERISSFNANNLDEQNPPEDCLNVWMEVQRYLQQIIPVDLQTSDPEKAQEVIADKLSSLEQNLEQQEKSLRIHVQSIPSHLNAEIRKQKSRIRKLNQKLEMVRFGFLQSIRINIETQPKLKRFLDILPQQLDIFADLNEENVSIEALMADLYEKEGAGKVKGDLLLDYRHYIRLNIEVKREGNQEFEKVTSTNLSTGESIGVGIAVLIIVLMSWEDQTYTGAGAEKRSSLRFLLLDESSRLDQKALYTLTDFCESLDLQLLIAAPTVERTLRGTTHHLTRGHFNGREEVIVRGRRFSGAMPESA